MYTYVHYWMRWLEEAGAASDLMPYGNEVDNGDGSFVFAIQGGFLT
jgi:hypothetical protein